MPLAADRLSATMRGALWMLVSVAGATVMTVAVRNLTADLHTAMIAFLRSAAALLFLAPLFLRRRPLANLRISRPWLHLARGALIPLALNLGFYAIWKLPLATATILFFLAPVFTTLLAPAMLGERVGPRRWAAVAAGFVGALVVLRPGLAEVEPAMLAAVGSSFCFALSLLLGKTASRADGPDAVFFSSAIVTAALTLPLALPFWSLPAAAAAWALVLLVALASSIRGYADIRAFAAADAAVLGPISYLRLPSIGAAGWLMFGETVDGWTLAGGAIIAGATLYILFRERALERPGVGASPGV